MTTATPEIKEGRQLNAIWIIPMVALLLGVYMVVHTYMTEGPEIKIALKSAEGLVAGKTKIKYLNVDMGLVTEVELTEDFEGVIAHVKMERSALDLLRDDTRFWVVTARIGAGGVSGLDTLLSGAYIRLGPGVGKTGQREFVAEERPPLTPADAPGLRLQLFSDRATSVSTGDTILYKGYKVGRVESRDFDSERRKVRYTVFIDAPFHELVNSSVRFWNYSGISLSAGADGFRVSTGSLETVLLGGVAFALPPGIPEGGPVAPEAEFELYDNYDGILQNPYRSGTYYVVAFDQSIKGLLPGAPVEYRGIPIGRVERLMFKDLIDMQLDAQRTGGELASTGAAIPVLLYVEPGRLELPDTEEGIAILRDAIERGVPNGMRAVLESGNLLTGAKYIGIDYLGEEGAEETGQFLGYTTIPTVGGGLDQIMVKVNAILDQVNKAPIEETISSANEALANLDGVLASLDTMLASQDAQGLPADLAATLDELRQTLDGLSPDSELYQNINSSMRQLNRTLNNVEGLTRTLSGQPNAAIMPSKLPLDPIPEARR